VTCLVGWKIEMIDDSHCHEVGFAWIEELERFLHKGNDILI
jgi:hypothetical protein